MNDIPIGVFQLRKFFRDDNRINYEIVDGLHRIKTIFNVLLGKGIYFDFEKKCFTLDNTKYNYSKDIINENNQSLNPIIILNISDFEKSKQFMHKYLKFYNIELLKFEYFGTDEEVNLAFERINDNGVAFTPIFNKINKEEILTL